MKITDAPQRGHYSEDYAQLGKDEVVVFFQPLLFSSA